jgi:hypothetical protein
MAELLAHARDHGDVGVREAVDCAIAVGRIHSRVNGFVLPITRKEMHN